MNIVAPKVNLLNFDRRGLEDFFVSLGEKPFRATQVLKWIHQLGVQDFAAMTNLSLKLREQLTEIAEVVAPQVIFDKLSEDGTRKWLLRLADGNAIETVFIPENDRGTLCVSSQVGCALNCSFCSTARQGFNRNLTVAEIIGQVWHAVRHLSANGQHKADRRVTNVVMMGMGEPLLNFDNVVSAMDLMMDDWAYGLSKYRVTLSTSGVVPALDKLSEVSDVSLAVSLHAPNDALRNELVPINKKYPIRALLDSCRRYATSGKRRGSVITFEYVMLKGVNDSLAHAKELVCILRGIPAKVNLIPFNPFPQAGYERSSTECINAFRAVLVKAGLVTVTRKTRGDDIDAACGQLVGKFHDRTQRSSWFRSNTQEARNGVEE